MLKEDPAPMTAHKTCAETVLLGREVGGDEGKDVQRDAVDANERVLPLAESSKCSRKVPFELRNHVQGDAAEGVSDIALPGVENDPPQRTPENMPHASVPRSGRI